MFTSIINAIVAIMTSLTTSAGAFNKVAISLDNLATVAEQTSAGYVDEARADREIAQMKRAKERAKALAELQAQ
jgi:uncharacterized protein YqfA (UPF0365 family)